MAAMTTGLFAACTGNENNGGDDPNGGGDATVTLELKVDKDVIDLDKSEKATFTVMLGEEDVTADAEIIEVTGGMYNVLSSSIYTTMRPGFHSFFASYGEYGSDIITVECNSEKGYSDTFYRRNLIMKFTGTWCSNCPPMSTALTQASRIYPDRILEIAAHGGGHNEPLENDASKYFISAYNITSYPSIMVDFDSNTITSNKVSTNIVTLCQKSLENNPTVVGIQATTEMGADNMLKVNTEMTIVADGNYKIGIYATRSGYQEEQAGAENMPDYRQNHVLKGFITENIDGDVLVDGGCVKGERVAKEYTEQFSTELTDEEKDLYRIIVAVFNEVEPGIYVVNNAVELELNDSADYEYEPLESLD